MRANGFWAGLPFRGAGGTTGLEVAGLCQPSIERGTSEQPHATDLVRAGNPAHLTGVCDLTRRDVGYTSSLRRSEHFRYIHNADFTALDKLVKRLYTEHGKVCTDKRRTPGEGQFAGVQVNR